MILVPAIATCAFTALLVGAWFSHKSTAALRDAQSWIVHTEEVLVSIETADTLMKDAESARRGYIVTGQPRELAALRQAEAQTPNAFLTIRHLTADNPRQQARLDGIVPLRAKEFRVLEESVLAKQGDLNDRNLQIRITNEGGQFMDRIESVLAEMKAEELHLLQTRRDAAEERSTVAETSLLLSGLAGVISLAVVLGLLLWENSRRRSLTEVLRVRSQEAKGANEQLSEKVAELESKRQEADLLARLSESLQAAVQSQEVYSILVRGAEYLFPETSGALCVINPSKNIVSAVATWGVRSITQSVFAPDECWALRSGRVHVTSGMAIPCAHSQPPDADSERELVCLPMTAQGEAVGVLTLETARTLAPGDRPVSTGYRRALAVAEQLSLALASLRLKEILRGQAVRDGLTGLFNRRFLEESLERESMRAQRRNGTFSILMIDVDHFKRFNDTYGHAAGDIVLQSLGQYLRANVRTEDVASRYGGEELCLLLVEASLENARRKAEHLREGARSLEIQIRGERLPAPTLSIGVATFPEHGTNPEALLRTADMALYEAKNSGRDRVVVGGSAELAQGDGTSG